MPSDLRGRLQGSLGHDLGQVKVHTSAESAGRADALGAEAFTEGQNIHFGAGYYEPTTQRGQHLIAHEVAHTVQQRGAPAVQQPRSQTGSSGDVHERQADAFADAFTFGLGEAPRIHPGSVRGTVQLRQRPERKLPTMDVQVDKPLDLMRLRKEVLQLKNKRLKELIAWQRKAYPLAAKNSNAFKLALSHLAVDLVEDPQAIGSMDHAWVLALLGYVTTAASIVGLDIGGQLTAANIVATDLVTGLHAAPVKRAKNWAARQELIKRQIEAIFLRNTVILPGNPRGHSAPVWFDAMLGVSKASRAFVAEMDSVKVDELHDSEALRKALIRLKTHRVPALPKPLNLAALKARFYAEWLTKNTNEITEKKSSAGSGRGYGSARGHIPGGTIHKNVSLGSTKVSLSVYQKVFKQAQKLTGGKALTQAFVARAFQNILNEHRIKAKHRLHYGYHKTGQTFFASAPRSWWGAMSLEPVLCHAKVVEVMAVPAPTYTERTVTGVTKSTPTVTRGKKSQFVMPRRLKLTSKLGDAWVTLSN